MEQFINNKKYLLIFILFIVLLLIIITYFVMTSRQPVSPDTTLQTSPTPITQITTTTLLSPTSGIPTAAAPEQFTGAKDVEFTETEAKQIDQERNLRRTSPYNASTFTVTYNPSTDIFEVTLVEPKTNSLNNFEIWRKIDYPNVSLERFTFN